MSELRFEVRTAKLGQHYVWDRLQELRCSTLEVFRSDAEFVSNALNAAPLPGGVADRETALSVLDSAGVDARKLVNIELVDALYKLGE